MANATREGVADGAGSTPSDAPFAAPQISLPKGGGALRGIGEKFAANPVTGTGSMSVPIATSPGRSGFGPQLSLSYDSGAGNGPFGVGWSLSTPSITRKTDKGLPRYRDADESDVYVLSGSEDHVPVLNPDGTRWEDESTAPGYVIHRYRPRIEGLFARIERWTEVATGAIHWRSISRDNVTTLYGKDDDSRIADPDASVSALPPRIFSWLICQSYDDKGNAVVYEYAEENDDGVDLSRANERNRNRAANRYLKRIKYGNRTPNRDLDTWKATDPTKLPKESWMFEVVFDYGEGYYTENLPDAEKRVFALVQIDPPAGSSWPARQDPFSTYRAGFEVRAHRLCRRVLMFHHFPEELKTQDYLVRSTEFTYRETPVASFITGVIQAGFVRQDDGAYLKRSLPPVEFEYTEARVQADVRDVDPESLANLPAGVDGTAYQWLDLDGEGLQGILAEQDGNWYYKRNLSPLTFDFVDGQPTASAKFEALTEVSRLPSFAESRALHHQFLDLAGDGRLDCVVLDRPVSGFFERTADEDWDAFRPLASTPIVDWSDPNLRMVDLSGDGHPDVLVSEDDVFTWYPSLAEDGFGASLRAPKPFDEEKGPAIVFADATHSIFLADMSGDGLTDIVRVRNGEVCYWPNLGYGRFGPKVSMDTAPWFDTPDQFEPRRVRLADIDGSGTTDLFYIGRDGVRLYFNQSGNAWSDPEPLPAFPRVDDLSTVQALDLLGNGTACLVWTSSLPGDATRSMRYIDLMGGQKPHLLVRSWNNLGAETRVEYAPSTKFYLVDRQAGRPWLTRLPFPVHVVERVETYDWLSRNRFVTRYTYHHGYYDGAEREFRGFGMVEQLDTEELGALGQTGTFPDAVNIDAASYVPPVLTRTWFHTGAWPLGDRVSRHFEDEYYRESDLSEGVVGLTDARFEAMLLPDTVFPEGLASEEIREACRSLKGAILRQEVYALDGTEESDRPYSVSERNYTINPVQPFGGNRHAVFFTHARETIDFHYERKLFDVAGEKLADPRVTHNLILAVDPYGNELLSVAIGYGRRHDDPDPVLSDEDRAKQTQVHITFTESAYTNPILEQDAYRAPAPSETRTHELGRFQPKAAVPGITNLFRFEDFFDTDGSVVFGTIPEALYEDPRGSGVPAGASYRRLIERVRTLYRKDDLTDLLALGELEPFALPGASYKLAFTPGLLADVFTRKPGGGPTQDLIPAPADVLGGKGDDHGGYVDLDQDGHWWIPSGRVFFSPGAADTPSEELATARTHFFLPRRFSDPFDQPSTVEYDSHDLAVVKTQDAIQNNVTALLDYRVLQPKLMTDPNGNQSQVVFDALGMVAGTAVMGKASESGDVLDSSFQPDLTRSEIDAFLAQPREASGNSGKSAATQRSRDLLSKATTRIVYDLDRFMRTGEPAFAATLARETHVKDESAQGQPTRIQISFSYSDGFGREIQKKIQAEPGPAPKRDASGQIIVGPDGRPEMTSNEINPRWVGSGWTIFNNKGKPVRQYEPFFTDTHHFELDVRIGVSPVLFYDPVERVVATLHPNHTWEKVVFDPWRQTSYDVNDTVALDPRTDPDVGSFFVRLPDADYLPTWYDQRIGGGQGTAEQEAATKSAAHANTPAVAFADSLGRTFLAVADNGPAGKYVTRTELDIEGNQRAVIDAKGRVVMEYDYDMLGVKIHQSSMEAGQRWMLNDVSGKPIRAWDSRGHSFRTEYDLLRRPLHSFVQGAAGSEADPRTVAREILFARTQYGEGQPDDVALNLRTRAVRQDDGAGIVAMGSYDFKGNLLAGARQLLQDYKGLADWSGQPSLEPETFQSATTYDALNRVLTATSPDDSVTRPTYNEANFLERMDVNLRGEKDGNGQPIWTPFVTNIDYDAKGQRERIDYGNGARTIYAFDPLTFRLTRLLTTRPANLDGLATSLFKSPGTVQDLNYTYDPAGNITRIADDALPAIFFDNQQVEPVGIYTYDAIYRLIEAQGREHIGQSALQLTVPQSTYRDYPFAGFGAQPFDPRAVRTYAEQYQYDEVGNFVSLKHQAGNDGWTRDYDCHEQSLVESAPGKFSNRLSRTTIAGLTEDYDHDAHGNMTAMPHLTLMRWDFQDRLIATSRQVVNPNPPPDSAPETTYFVYDGSGQRVRKVTQNQSGYRRNERIYVGGFELYREYDGSGKVITLERGTLQVMDDKQRIALVETKTVENQSALPIPQSAIRYQLANHLRSANLELDDTGQLISYEEYHPHGTTSYQAGRSAVETSIKRYRYTGKERDVESGLYYHRARYYAPWLGRWTATDPAGPVDGPDLYVYVANSPVNLTDPSGTQNEPTIPSAPPGLPGTQVWFYEFKVFFERVTATVTGRGFNGRMYENALKIYQTWGGEGTPDLAHVEKPFALTKAGETTHFAPQDPIVNRDYGRTVDKANVAAARAKGEFTRVTDVDPGGTKGTRFGQPQPSDFYKSQEFRDLRVPAAPQTTPATPPAAAAEPPTGAAKPVPEQLNLPFDKPPATPAPPAAPLAPPPPVEPPAPPPPVEPPAPPPPVEPPVASPVIGEPPPGGVSAPRTGGGTAGAVGTGLFILGMSTSVSNENDLGAFAALAIVTKFVGAGPVAFLTVFLSTDDREYDETGGQLRRIK